MEDKLKYITIKEINDCFTGLTTDSEFERGLSTALQIIDINTK